MIKMVQYAKRVTVKPHKRKKPKGGFTFVKRHKRLVDAGSLYFAHDGCYPDGSPIIREGELKDGEEWSHCEACGELTTNSRFCIDCEEEEDGDRNDPGLVNSPMHYGDMRMTEMEDFLEEEEVSSFRKMNVRERQTYDSALHLLESHSNWELLKKDMEKKRPDEGHGEKEARKKILNEMKRLEKKWPSEGR